MKQEIRIIVKILIVLPVCLATLMGPFFIARWLRVMHGIDVPSLLVLGFALFVTLSLYFWVLKKDMRDMEKKWRERDER